MAIGEKTYEEDNRTRVNHEGPLANKPVKRLTATSLIGDRVENFEGEDLGKVENFMINMRTGHVEYVVISFGTFLGMGGKLFAVPFTELRLNPEKRVLVINRTKQALKASPGFDSDRWPDTNDHSYFDNVKLFYGSYTPPYP